MKNFFAELRRRNVVRVGVFYVLASWLILQVADVLFGLLSVPDWTLRFVLGILLLGLPLALIFSWVYELTPEGLKRERDLDPAASDTRSTGRKLDAVTLVLVVLTLGLLAWDRLTREPASEGSVSSAAKAERGAEANAPAAGARPDLSIAVLPFANMSEDASNEYFSDGLSEELLNLLAKVPDFRVAGRTSSFAFKGKNEDLRAIGEKLSVAHILEGSVRRQGDRIRVTAQLVSAEDGYHLWSETYDDQLEDVFAIQDAIATSVVQALKTTLLPADQDAIAPSATESVEAYRHYLKGKSHARTRTPDSLEEALGEFQQAILIDPDYAPAYAGMAVVYALMDNYGYRSLADTGAVAERAIERALALDPTASDAWAAKGLYLSQRAETGGGSDGSEEAVEAFRKALIHNPNNAQAYLWLSTALLPDEEASHEAETKAYELDPLSPVIMHRQVVRAIDTGRTDEARKLVAELKDEAPDWFLTWMREADLAGLEGRLDRRVIALEKARELNPLYWPAVLGLAHAVLDWGDSGRALELVDSAPLEAFAPETIRNLAWLRAEAAIMAGDPAGALAGYRRQVDGLDDDPSRIAEEAMLTTAAGDPAAAEQMLRAGLERLGISQTDADNRSAYPLYALSVALYAQNRPGETGGLRQALERFLDVAATQNPSNSQFTMVRSWLHALAGDAEAAVAAFRQAMDEGYRDSRTTLELLAPQLRALPRWETLAAEMEAVLAADRERYQMASSALRDGTGQAANLVPVGLADLRAARDPKARQRSAAARDTARFPTAADR